MAPYIQWTRTQEHALIHLRDIDRKPWAQIALILSRSFYACQQHYALVKQAAAGSLIDWTPEQDHHIIDGRRRGLTIKAISTEMALPSHAVADRWHALLREKKVPEDVLALWRRKEVVTWSTDEDEFVLKMWISGMEDDDIVKAVRFKGKSQDDVRARRVELVNEDRGMYLKMLGVGGGGKEVLKNALEKALGKPKYSWMK